MKEVLRVEVVPHENPEALKNFREAKQSTRATFAAQLAEASKRPREANPSN